VHLPPHYVVHVCRLVSREWRALVDTESLWRDRCRREGYRHRGDAAGQAPKDWKIFYFLSKARRNLLKNTRAEGQSLRRTTMLVLSLKGPYFTTRFVISCCIFALNCFAFTVFVYSVKHFELPQCMKGAIQIKLPCLKSPFKIVMRQPASDITSGSVHPDV